MSKPITLAQARARQQAEEAGAVKPHLLAGQPVPERRWLVPHLVPRGAVTMLSGDGGVGKSLLAMQLMTAGAVGGKWIGIDVPRFTSLGFFCEDDRNELHRRQIGINRHFGCGLEDLEAITWLPRVFVENVMVQFAKDSHTPPRLNKPYRDVEELVRAHAIELIVIDTVADVFGGNENFRTEVRAFIAHMRALARINDGAVLLMAHPSVAGQQSGTGLSGSTAWNNSVRSRLYFTRPRNAGEDEADARELRGMKANYSTSGAKIRLRYEQGVFVRDDSGTGMVAAIEARNLAKRFAELVAIATTRKINLSPSPSNVYAPSVLRRLPEARGLTQEVLIRAMHDALADGLVKVVETGRASRVRTRLLPISAPELALTNA